ncbi:conserved hypothetical protein [Candidatus Terasakiella magnetica]|nr:conserved hypothetical protein [Candidatus Terasakiella magnetica]
MQETETGGPVTVSIARRVKPGREADYEAWILGVTTEVSAWPGYLGANVLRPAAATEYSYVTIYRFQSWESCHAFEKSDQRRVWLDKLDDMVEGEGQVKRVTGLEFWFDLPEVPAQSRPSQHKMALVVTLVAYVTVLCLNLLLGPFVAAYPLWLKALIFVSAQVLLMTYVFMPQVTRLLRRWLYHPER